MTDHLLSAGSQARR